MTAPFKLGDIVLCIEARKNYVAEGFHYVVNGITHDNDGTFYVSVHGVFGRHRAERFELVSDGTPEQTPVIRKIKQLERRYKERMAA